MSSIYRKNRDGYFYYQAYVYNPKSKKKDKRIFHALATKSEVEAKIKQAHYDKKYKNLSSYKQPSFFGTLFQKHKKTILAVVFSSLFTFLVRQKFQKTLDRSADTQNNIQLESVIINQIDKDYNQEKKVKAKENENPILDQNIIVNQKEQNKIIAKKLKVPSYKIIRKEQLSEAFDQWKLFVVVENNLDSKSLRKICNMISNDYSNHQNIVICIYLNDDVGMKIALGKKVTYSSDQEKDSWLAMYTYNSVEGAFFDDKPGQFTWTN